MPDPKKVFPARFNEFETATWAMILLIISIIGVAYAAIRRVNSGYVYAILFTVVVSVIVLLGLFRKDEDRPTSFLRVPFAKSYDLSVTMYALGLGFAFILAGLTLLTSFSILDYSVPLATQGDGFGQDFSVTQIEESMPWKIFNIFYVAGIIESFIFNWGGPILAFFLVNNLLRKLSKGRSEPNIVLVLILTFALSSAFFAIAHSINNTYTNFWRYLAAYIFLTVQNVSIYVWGVPLEFWIGYHQANNLIYLVTVFGIIAVLNGLLSVFGLVLAITLFILAFYLINNPEKAMKALRVFWSS